jgi:hypothetical protein
MTSTGLLAAVMLFCSLPAFAQDQPTSTTQIPGNSVPALVTSKTAAPAPLEPWKIVPNRASALNSDRIRIDQFRLDPGKVYPLAPTSTFKVARGVDGSLDDDAACYTIRSYVVARDSKDSDSTHPAGYSTCRRASRYHLKTTEGQSVSTQR